MGNVRNPLITQKFFNVKNKQGITVNFHFEYFNFNRQKELQNAKDLFSTPIASLLIIVVEQLLEEIKDMYG